MRIGDEIDTDRAHAMRGSDGIPFVIADDLAIELVVFLDGSLLRNSGSGFIVRGRRRGRRHDLVGNLLDRPLGAYLGNDHRFGSF